MNYAAIAVPDNTATSEMVRAKPAPPRADPSPKPRPEKRQRPELPPRPMPMEPAPKRARADVGDLERRKIIKRIRLAASWFPETAGEIVKSKNLEKLDIHQLQELEVEVRFDIGTSNSSLINTSVSQGALQVMEGMVTSAGFKVDGPTIRLSDLQKHPDYQSLLKELMLDFSDFVYESPWKRMGLFLLQSAAKVHAINNSAAQPIAPPPTPTPPPAEHREAPPPQPTPPAPRPPAQPAAPATVEIIVDGERVSIPIPPAPKPAPSPPPPLGGGQK